MKVLRALALCTPLAAAAALLPPTAALAQTMQMWVRESAADPAKLMIDLWNSSHDAKVELTAIPDNQVVTKLATSVRAGDAPDLVSFDLIYMPDFMRAGFLADLTEQLDADPNYATTSKPTRTSPPTRTRSTASASRPDVSILVWNKELFRQAGLDPEVPPKTIYEIHEMATKIHASGDDTYGFYFAGSCPGCNIFVTSPLMVAGGAKILPRNGEDAALEGKAVFEVLDQYRQMWEEGLVPESAEVDAGENFVAAFTNGNVGIAGTGGFLLSLMQRQFPDFDYGVTLLPGLEPGQVSGFVGGDVVAIPEGSPNEASGPRVRHLGAERRGAARRARQERHPHHPHRPRRQRVLRRQREGAGDRQGARGRLRALGLPLRRHGELGFEPVDQHAAAGDLRRRRRGRHRGRAGAHAGDRQRVGWPSDARRPPAAGAGPLPRSGRRMLATNNRLVGLPLPRAGARSSWRCSSSIRSSQLVYMSLTSESLLGGGEFVWFDNYVEALRRPELLAGVLVHR